MSFALTSFKAFGLRCEGATRKHVRQRALLIATGTSADVALDISNYAGTFWTAALADATYGKVATAAIAALKQIQAASSGLLAVLSPSLINRVKVASLTGAGQYTISITSSLPSIALNAGDGDTSYIIELEFDTKVNLEAVVSDIK